jgi:hypothetical protein
MIKQQRKGPKLKMEKVINLEHRRNKRKLSEKIQSQYKRIEEQINEIGDIILAYEKSKEKED